MFPVRLSIVSYNLWNTERWPERKSALGQFVVRFCPDVLCVQELRTETQVFLDEAMPRHCRVHDDLPGWTCESNIFWNGDLFQEVEYGAEDVGILEEHRRFFWVRLRFQERTLFVSTAHFTHMGHPKENETGLSPRLEQTRRTVDALRRLVGEDEPVFFTGDLNDPVHPTRILHEEGYVNCFSALGILCPPTWPCCPTANIPAGARVANQTIDWIVGNQHARPIAAHVPRCYHGDMAPSDHWPVLAVYEI